MAAQLDGAARLRIEPADRERVGDHLLNVRGAQRGRDIARTEIKFDEAATGVGTGDLVTKLKQGEYAIYFRGYKANEGIIEADVRSVNAEQLNIVFRRIREVLGQEKNA